MERIVLPAGCDPAAQSALDAVVAAVSSASCPAGLAAEAEAEIVRRLVDDKGREPCHYARQAKAIHSAVTRRLAEHAAGKATA